VPDAHDMLDFVALEQALGRAEHDLDYDRYRSARRRAHAVQAQLAGASTDEVRVRIAFARALLIEGRSAERLGKTEEAQGALELMQEVLRGDEPPVLRLEADILQGVLLGSRGEIEAASEVFAEVEPHLEHIPSLLGWLVSRKGVLFSWQGRQREALECFDRAAVIEMQADRTHRMHVIENSIALCHLALGDLELSLELFRDTLLGARAVDNGWAEGLALVNMAEVFYESGDYGHALDLYRQTLEVSRRIGADRLEGDALAWIGQIFNRLGDFERAREHLHKAIEHHKKRDDGFQSAVARICLGEVELDAGDEDLAACELEAGLKIAEQLDSGYLRTKGLLARARLHRGRGDLMAAQADLGRAVTLSSRLEERRLQIWARRDLALLQSEPEARAAGLLVALGLAVEHGFVEDRVSLLLARAEALGESGQAEAALDAYREYVGARQAQFDQESDFRLRQQQVLYALEHAQHEVDRHKKLSEQLEAANRELERLATTDGLTQVANRRHLWSRAHAELARTQRNGSGLSVVLLDLDDFKHVNDTLGHDTGDRVLVAVAGVFEQVLRASDVVGRIGGEEFCVLLPDTLMHAAMEVAERLRVAIQGLEVQSERGLARPTASFGVATCRDEGESFATIVKRADAAVYRAKAAGRNQVSAAEAP